MLPKTTLAAFAKHIEHAAQLDDTDWRGDGPACDGRHTITWDADANGRAADFTCSAGCTEAQISAAAKARAVAMRTKNGVAATVATDDAPTAAPLLESVRKFRSDPTQPRAWVKEFRRAIPRRVRQPIIDRFDVDTAMWL